MKGTSIKKSLSFVFYLIFLQWPALSQHVVFDSLVQKFRQYREHALHEKIYAHIDQHFHLTGETLWFKLYTVDGSFHKPLDLSKVAYAEILDRSDLPVLQAKIELRNGCGHGSFFLPASLSTGNYKFRVYTSWMKNFPPQFYYQQIITIVNPFLVSEPTLRKETATCRVDFFPEGGNLVSGLESKVAFKVSDNSGTGKFCNGFIQSDRGDTVVTFAPMKFGLGTFTIRPSTDKKYHAVLIDESGGKRTYAFPQVYPTGMTMQLRDSGEFVRISVRSKGAADGNVYLFVHARQIIARAQSQHLKNNAAVFSVEKEDLAEGISHFTLFDERLQPVCERLYFTYPSRRLDIMLSANQKIFTPRSRVSVRIETRDPDQRPAISNLSMSVYKVDSLSVKDPAGIYPYLWLDSDLSGTIESPQYYFDHTSPDVTVAMDNLMLTHGWRRFDWKHVLNGPPVFRFLPEVREHIVTGIVSSEDRIQRGVFTYLGSPGKIIRAYGSWSDAEGQVRFEIKDFYGPRQIILQTRPDSGAVYNIKILDPFSQERDAERLPQFTFPQNVEEEIRSRSISMQVQDIYYYDRYANRIIEPEVDSSAFYGKADATYFLDDYTRFPVMEEVMREYVPGVFVRKRKDGFHFIVIDEVHRGVLHGEPMVLLDGVPVLDVDDIMHMDPLRVKKLEVVQRQYHLGQSVFSGIVSYTTYQGDLGGLELDPRSISLNYDGLHLKREFHSPQYGGEKSRSRLPDQRHLLHWEPVINIGSDGKSQLEFYTSDVAGHYIIVVEGVDERGHSGSGTYTFTVGPADDQ